MKPFFLAIIIAVIFATFSGCDGPKKNRIEFSWEGYECTGPSFYDGLFPYDTNFECTRLEGGSSPVTISYRNPQDKKNCGLTGWVNEGGETVTWQYFCR